MVRDLPERPRRERDGAPPDGQEQHASRRRRITREPRARGASSAASAANAVVDGVRNLVTETAEGKHYSMCLSSNGQYGVDKGLIFSYACRTINGECVVVEEISHEGFGKEKFDATLDELRSERDTVKSLGLI